MVLLILAALWVIFLLPQLLRFRPSRRKVDSVEAFRNQLSVLGRTRLSASAAASSSETVSPSDLGPAGLTLPEARRRRRDILVGLGSMAAVTLFFCLLGARVLAPLHLAIDALLVLYLALLFRAYSRGVEREAMIHYLPSAPSSEAALLLRRSAN